jgi:OmpA-OmpF porin, OOP family
MKGFHFSFPLIVLALFASPIGIASAAEPGVYFGGTVGAATVKEDELDDDDSRYWKAYLGTQMNEWFGLEASWLEFDRAEGDNADFETDGVSGAAVISFPVGQTSSLYVKAGQYWWDSSVTVAGVSVSDSGNDVLVGAGLNLGFTDHLHLRLEFERYKVEDVDIDGASAGLQITF